MRTNQEVRSEIIHSLVQAFREVRRVERLLRQPKMTRTFRTKCPAAKAQAEMKLALQEGLADAEHELLTCWWQLPEVRNDIIPIEGELERAKAFAAQCAQRKRHRKFMKGQGLLLTAR
jgi:hypothetical protein